MEVLLIGKSKMKIVLNAEQMKGFGLNVTDECKDTASVRRRLYAILEDAGRISGFDYTEDKLLIQFYPMESGGCEVFVTKLGLLPDVSAKMVQSSDRITVLSKRRSYYAFSSSQDLTSALIAIKNHPSAVKPKGDIYLTKSGKYLLSLEEYGKEDFYSEFALIHEFATKLKAETECYIIEHCDFLCGIDAYFDRINP